MALDYKKEQKELYRPKTVPSIVDVPVMTFIAVDGVGNPNTSTEYAAAAEGLCAQILHIGPYDNEPESVSVMEHYIDASGYKTDFSDDRRHHEIYLSDPRKTVSEKLKTVIRYPIKL